MRVTVKNGSQQTIFDDISSIGIGHQEKHLVLVPQIGPAIQIEPLEWTRIAVERAPLEVTQEQASPNPPARWRRAIDLDGF